ncbi:MAG: ABC transporter permease [Firmicutes bacterium]|nr:ABC transporter permease [Dethiobacter sp.]MBS3888231.1 ABC transporter permease [Bacillota bacterium]MBS4054009.1 ABC transporter permease [Thermaerobacter sp.]
MSAFKVCLKIIKNNLPGIVIYFVVFVAVSIIMTFVYRPSAVGGGTFAPERVDIVLFTDEETALVAGLREALATQVNFVALPDNAEQLQEELFYRRIHYILRVPAGFTEAFLQNTPMLLSKTSVAGSSSAVYIDLRVERYLELLRLYTEVTAGLSLEQQVAFALDDLSQAVEVRFAVPEVAAQNRGRLGMYFNFLPYTILFVITVGVAAIFIAFGGEKIKQRNLCSPLNPRTISLQCYLACLVFALASWGVLVVVSLMFGHQEIASRATWFYILNSLVFTLSAAGLAYLLGNLTQNKEVVLAAANVVALGTSFISGVFVPQELLGVAVLRVASFTPTYWYVRANAAITALTTFNLTTLSGFFSSLAVQLGFAAAFVVIALAVEKGKRAPGS